LTQRSAVLPPVDQRLTERARIAEKDANLAVLDPPGRAGILPRDPDRVSAFLQEASLIDHQHAARITQ